MHSKFYLVTKCLNGFVFDGLTVLGCIDFVYENKGKKN